MAVSVIATQSPRPGIAEDPVAPAVVSATVLDGDGRPGSGGQRWRCAGASVRWRGRAGWSSASRAWLGSVGRVIFSESLRPAFGDQRVDEFAVAGTVGERAARLLGWVAALCGHGVGRVRRPGHGLILAGGVAASRRFADAAGGGTPACRCLWLGRGLASSPSGLGGWRSLAPGKRICGKTLARVLISHAAARGPQRLPAGCAGSG